MGDVGDAFLGFTFAAMPLMAYSQTGNPRMPIVGVLFVAPFALDGALTIVRRALHRENIFAAHRSHLYQRLVIAGLSHRQVTNQYRRLMLLSGMCGVIYMLAPRTTLLLYLQYLESSWLTSYMSQ